MGTKCISQYKPGSGKGQRESLVLGIIMGRTTPQLLALMKNFKTSIDGTGTKLAVEKINYIRTLISGEEL